MFVATNPASRNSIYQHQPLGSNPPGMITSLDPRGSSFCVKGTTKNKWKWLPQWSKKTKAQPLRICDSRSVVDLSFGTVLSKFIVQEIYIFSQKNRQIHTKSPAFLNGSIMSNTYKYFWWLFKTPQKEDRVSIFDQYFIVFKVNLKVKETCHYKYQKNM